MEINRGNRVFYLALSLSLCLWAVVFYQGYTTAFSVWVVSDIYNHCLFVVPCSLYFIYQKRHQLAAIDFKPTFIPLIALLGAIFIQLFALVGDIKILMHIATFISLPLLIWLLIGHQAAKCIVFPLFFLSDKKPKDQPLPHFEF